MPNVGPGSPVSNVSSPPSLCASPLRGAFSGARLNMCRTCSNSSSQGSEGLVFRCTVSVLTLLRDGASVPCNTHDLMNQSHDGAVWIYREPSNALNGAVIEM